MTRDVGVVIGRFQVDEIHEGHVALLEEVARRHENMLVLLGCRHSPADNNNPLEFRARAQMIVSIVPHATVLAIHDTPLDSTWSMDVDRTVAGAFPFRDAVLYGGRDSFQSHYAGRFATETLWFEKSDSGSERRQAIVAAPPEDDPAFRRGVIYGIGNLPPRVYMTVDIAAVADGMVCLVRKPTETLWRFPGGFVDREDTSLEMSAERELREETGIEPGPHDELEYAGSRKIDDWRSRDAQDTAHATAFFVCQLAAAQDLRAADDVVEAAYFTIGSSLYDRVAVEHAKLVVLLLRHIAGQWDVACPDCSTLLYRASPETIIAKLDRKLVTIRDVDLMIAAATRPCEDCVVVPSARGGWAE